jgi:hypothetical protein
MGGAVGGSGCFLSYITLDFSWIKAGRVRMVQGQVGQPGGPEGSMGRKKLIHGRCNGHPSHPVVSVGGVGVEAVTLYQNTICSGTWNECHCIIHTWGAWPVGMFSRVAAGRQLGLCFGQTS